MTGQIMLWIAIAGLFFTIFSLFLTIIGLSIGFYFQTKNLKFKIEERTSPYIVALYIKRLEGFLEIADVIVEIYYQIKTCCYPNKKFTPTPYISDSLKEKREILKSRSKKWAVVFPKKLNDNIQYFLPRFDVMIERRHDNLDIEKRSVDRLLICLDDIFDVAHDVLGVGKLSEEMGKFVVSDEN
jgi:hypothetical protein